MPDSHHEHQLQLLHVGSLMQTLQRASRSYMLAVAAISIILRHLATVLPFVNSVCCKVIERMSITDCAELCTYGQPLRETTGVNRRCSSDADCPTSYQCSSSASTASSLQICCPRTRASFDCTS
jgi:hypothetical protein